MAPRRVAPWLLAASSGALAFVPISPAPRAPERAGVPGLQGSQVPRAQAKQPQSWGCVTAAAGLLLAAACSSKRRRRIAGSAPLVTELASPTEVPARATSVVTMHAAKNYPPSSCNALFFKKGREYEQRHRRNLRNRSYNLYNKNRYLRQMRRVMWYMDKVERNLIKPKNKEEMYDAIGNNLTFACLYIDYCAVQGIFGPVRAAFYKDKMMRKIKDVYIKMKWPLETKDRFAPAYVAIGYRFPVYKLQREPRPWQLPGWKSPEMLRREYLKWVERRNKKIEELRAAKAEE